MACGEWRLGGGRGSGAWVKLNEDGTVHLLAGMSEIGSGSSTAMVQIAAEVLGVEADAVALVSGDTETTPFDTLTAASRVTVSVGNAVKRAATDARDQLLQLAAERLEANVADLECRDSRIFVKGSPDRGFGLGELARYAQTLGAGPILGRGAFSSRPPQSLHTFGTQIVEVEVDEETGQVTLTRIVAAHDVGCAINPQGVEGQIQGGVTQAIGHTLMEEVKYPPMAIHTPLASWTIRSRPSSICRDRASDRRRGRRRRALWCPWHRRAADTRHGPGHRQRHLRCRWRAHHLAADHG